jgi:hypothetical protein
VNSLFEIGFFFVNFPHFDPDLLVVWFPEPLLLFLSFHDRTNHFAGKPDDLASQVVEGEGHRPVSKLRDL